MARPLPNEGSANPPLLKTAIGDQIWHPVFSPETIVEAQQLDILYDVQTKTYFMFDVSTSGLKSIYTLSPQTITQKEADTLFKSGLFPSSLQQPQDSPAMKAFVQRFGLDSAKILSSLLTYHAVHDGVMVSMRKKPTPVSLHEYYGTTISLIGRKYMLAYLNLLRPATELAHRCTTVVLCAEGVLFCQHCACFFKAVTKNQILSGQLGYSSGMNYLRLPVGKVVLGGSISHLVKPMMVETLSRVVTKSAYQHLGGIFKINFGRMLSAVPAHVLLALLLACSLFIEKKGTRLSAEDIWSPIQFGGKLKLSELRTGLKVGFVHGMDMKRILERENLHAGGIECFLRVEFPLPERDAMKSALASPQSCADSAQTPDASGL